MDTHNLKVDSFRDSNLEFLKSKSLVPFSLLDSKVSNSTKNYPSKNTLGYSNPIILLASKIVIPSK